MSADVLIVDDDPDIRRVVAAVLGDAGYAVRLAADGREVLARIHEDQPALVVLDLQLPVLTGWDLTAALQRAGTPVPIIFMTAGPRAAVEAARFGVCGSVAKPFDLDALLDVVARCWPGATPAS